MLVRIHEGVTPLASTGEGVREQRDLHPAARVDASVLGGNAAHIVPAVAALFEPLLLRWWGFDVWTYVYAPQLGPQ